MAAAWSTAPTCSTARTIVRLVGAFRVLLEAALAEPVAARRAAAPGRSERASSSWRSGTTPPRLSADAACHELFEEQAARRPEAVAVVFGEERLTYARAERGAPTGSPTICGSSASARTSRVGHLPGALRRRWSSRLLAVLKAGGAYVPLDPSYPQERLAFMLEDARLPGADHARGALGTAARRRSRIVCAGPRRGGPRRLGEKPAAWRSPRRPSPT